MWTTKNTEKGNVEAENEKRKEISLISFNSNKLDQCHLDLWFINWNYISQHTWTSSQQQVNTTALEISFFFLFFSLLIQLPVLLYKNKPEQTLQNYLETIAEARVYSVVLHGFLLCFSPGMTGGNMLQRILSN